MEPNDGSEGGAEDARAEPTVHDRFLALAAGEGQIPYLRMALEHGADPRASVIDPFTPEGRRPRPTTALDLAVDSGSEEAVRLLLDACPREVLDKLAPRLASRARRPVARMILEKSGFKSDDQTLRSLFGRGMIVGNAFGGRRDWVGFCLEWIDAGADPYAPDFGGDSLLDFCANGIPSTEDMDCRTRAEAMFFNLCDAAADPVSAGRALVTATRVRRLGVALDLSKRGALAGLGQDGLDTTVDLCAQALRDFDSEQGIDLLAALLEAGADGTPLANLIVSNSSAHLSRKIFVKAPGKAAAMADSNGRGLLWDTVDLIWRDPEATAARNTEAELARDLLKVPGVRVLTGNGLGEFGPPVSRLAARLSRHPVNRKKGVKPLDDIWEAVARLALAEAEAVDATGACGGVALPGEMNVLHLAALAGQGDAAAVLVGKVAGLGKPTLRKMLGQEAQVLARLEDPGRATSRWFSADRPKAEPMTPLAVAEAFLDHGLALAFAELVGVGSKVAGKPVAETLVRTLPTVDGEMLNLLGNLFGKGLDPRATASDGRPLSELLKESLRERDRLATREERDARDALIDKAFLEASAPTSRRRGGRDDTPPKPRGGTL